IRNWVGQIGDEELYEACDKYGIMLWQDFWLANPWDGPDPYNEAMFLANSADYISRIRNHACVGIYVGRNEGYPPASIDSALRQQIQQLHPQLGYIPSSADDGVSGHGPYGMQPTKVYFEKQSQKLHSERGMPNIPTFESLSRMLNPNQLWPQGDAWGQHDFTLKGAQGGESFNATFANHFGEPRDARQFTKLAQWLNYDGYRAMYESTQQYRMGLLIWMSHACWPSMVWCTYDYYFEPTAAYFGVKKACEPLHIQYNPLKQSVEVVNYAGGARKNLLAKAQLLTMKGEIISEKQQTIDVNEDVTLQALQLQLPTNQEVYYIRLYLMDGETLVSENFYVEGQQADQLQVLSQLPQVELQAEQGSFTQDGEEWRGEITLTNATQTPALLIRLNLKGYDGEQILPVIYSDNYFALMPGESKTVQVSYRNEDSRGTLPVIEVSGFNMK
ncbi:MAG: glycoside hydrolase family 2 protein, partial [Bacteroides sp.]